MHPGRVRTAAAFVGLLLACLGEAFGQRGILISPQVAQIELPPGGSKIYEITVANSPDNAPMTLDVRVAPIEQDDHGSYTIAKSDNAWSCAAWTKIDRVQVTLGPGESQTVKVKLEVPSNAAGGKYAAVVFSFTEKYKPTAGLNQTLTYQLGSFIELTITKTRTIRKAEVSDLKIESVIGNTMLENQYGKDAFFIVAKVRNEGNIGVFAKATLRIQEQRGLHVREVPLGEGRGMVLPGQTVEYRSLFPGRPPAGNYTAEATVNYEGIRPSVNKMIFSVASNGELKPGVMQAVQTLGLDVIPRSIDVAAPAGSKKTIGVTLNNVEDHQVAVSTSILSFDETSDGRFVTKANSGQLQEASWVKIDPDTFEIPPKTRKHIKIDISVPEGAQGARYLRAAFVPQGSAVSTEALHESYSTDIFLSIPPGLSKDVALKSFKAESAGRFKPVSFSFGASNQGNCHVDIDASITVTDSNGESVRDIRLSDRNTRILPGLTRTFTMEDSQGFESGAYNCDLTVKIGKTKTLISKYTLKI